jgi:hypothetical protein
VVERKLLLFSAVLLIAGEVLYQVAQYFHAGEGATTVKGGFTAYAHSAPWVLVHAAQFASSAILIFGILALYFALNVDSGIFGGCGARTQRCPLCCGRRRPQGGC